MNPTLKYGDIVVVLRTSQDDYHPKDIVIYYQHEILFVHRIVKIQNGYCYTKGDALSYLDDPIDRNEILGKIVEIRES